MRLAVLFATVCLAAPQTQPTFRSGVELVEVAVLVRDRDGRPVTDLSPSDFQLRDDGAPQAIAAFERVSLAIDHGPVASPALAPAVPRDVASNEGVSNARIFVLVLDALHVSSVRTQAVRDAARQFVERHAGPSDLTAVLSPGGLSGATQDFTSDKARLIAAIEQFAGSKLRSATVERDEEQRRGEVVLHGGMDPSDYERANRAASLSSVLQALANHLGRVEGRRKSLILFSEGIDYDVTDVMGEVQRNASDVMHAMDRAVAALMRTNVSVYTIDPRGLSSAEGDQLESPLHRAFPDFTRNSVASEYASSIRGLRDLAESTGGFAAVDTNGFAGAFERIVEENSEYYVVGYTPSKPPKPGVFRRIDVRVLRPGVTVVARRGYVIPDDRRHRAAAIVAPDAAQPAWIPGRPRGSVLSSPVPEVAPAATRGLSAELGVLLASPLPRSGLPLRLQAIPSIPARGPGDKAGVQLVVEVLGRSLQFIERGGRFEARIELAMLTVDGRARGDNGRSTTLDMRLTAEERDRVKRTGVRWLSRLELKPGRYQVRVAARAVETGATGLIAHDVEVPSFDRERLGLSGITLTSLTAVLMITKGDRWMEDALDTPPSAARTFVAGDRLTTGVQVYVPASASGGLLRARIESADGSTRQTSERRIAGGQGRARVHDVGLPFDTTSLAEGRYVLRLALDAPDSMGGVQRSMPFEIVRPAR